MKENIGMDSIEKTKDVWIAWTNTDLTEGRGHRIPYVICDNIITAKRLGKNKAVQGTDCNVTKEKAYLINNKWVSNVNIQDPSLEDKKKIELYEKEEKIKQKALDLGLTIDEIKILKQNSSK